MSERMSNERAIEILEKERDTFFDEMEHYSIGGVPIGQSARELLEALDIAIECIEHEEKCNKAINDSTKAIAEMERLCAKCQIDNEWVDVKDRLPSENELVLVTYKYKLKNDKEWRIEVGTDILYHDGWRNHKNILAWKPLPQPYEGKE